MKIPSSWKVFHPGTMKMQKQVLRYAQDGKTWLRLFSGQSAWSRVLKKKFAANRLGRPSFSGPARRQFNLSQVACKVRRGRLAYTSLERDGLHRVRRNRNGCGAARPLGGKRDIGCVDFCAVLNSVKDSGPASEHSCAPSRSDKPKPTLKVVIRILRN